MTNEEQLKAGTEELVKKEAVKAAAEFLKTMSDAELEAIWEVVTVQIATVAAEKAERMGVKNPKIAVLALGGDENLADILGNYAHVEGPLVTPKVNDVDAN